MGPLGARSTTVLADPAHFSAWRPPLAVSPQPACMPPLVATATELQKPLGYRSTTLEAVPRHSRACRSQVRGAIESWPLTELSPACSPSPMPEPLVRAYPLGCKSTARYCVGASLGGCCWPDGDC